MSGTKKFTTGGKAVSGGALSPRSGRGSTDQAAAYWAGGGGLSYAVATGGTIRTYTSGGVAYKSHTFESGSNFVLTAQGTNPVIDLFVVGGGGAGGGTGLGRGPCDGGGGAGGNVRTSMTLPTGTYQVTIGGAGQPSGGAGGTTTFGTSPLSLITAGGGGGGSGCEFCCGGGGAGGSASVGGSLGTSSVTTAGFAGRGGCAGAGQTNGQNNFMDGTNYYYSSTAGSSCSCQGTIAGGQGASPSNDGACNVPCYNQVPTTFGTGGVGGTPNCGTGQVGKAGIVIVRYEFVG
jgi:hypothetical protein